MPDSFVALKRLSLLFLATLLFSALFADSLPFSDPLEMSLSQALSPPSAQYFAGTDQLGRDIFSRVIYAAKPTLVITICATLLCMIIGTALGMAAGYIGGLWRKGVDFAIDLFWSVPFVIFVLLIVALFGANETVLILGIGGINWVTCSRIIRDETATLKKNGFLLTLLAFGYKKKEIIFIHLLPNLKPTLLALAAYSAVEVLTLETGLAFLGMSLPPPQPTWGGLLADGLAYFSNAWWLVAAPTAAIILSIGSLHTLAGHYEKRFISMVR